MQLIMVKHSILSGLFAALAALFGKVATTPDISRTALSSIISSSFISTTNFNYALWMAQSGAVALMIASNAIMWSQYSLALAFSQVTLHVTAINTVSNFIFTGLIGRIIFGETLSLEWAMGISCILAGIVLLKEQTDTVLSVEKEDEKKKK